MTCMLDQTQKASRRKKKKQQGEKHNKRDEAAAAAMYAKHTRKQNRFRSDQRANLRQRLNDEVVL